MNTRPLLTAAALSLAVAQVPSSAQTVWLAGTDDWFVPANWSLGVPTAATDAHINNGGVAEILAGSAEVQQLTLGSMGGESGTLTLMNTGASLAATTLTLGDAGSGTLSITADADLMADTVTIANSGGTSTATISGAGSTLTTTGVLTVGRSGNGTIAIDTGAVVTASDVQLGFLTGGVGTATIGGIGSRWNVSGQFTVGGGLSGGGPGSGSLTISDGAVVDVSNAVQGIGLGVVVMGNQAGTTCQATVTGAGSSLIASNVISVANRGQGSLTISAGGLAQTDGTAIGYENGSVGAMLVTGAGSRYEDTLNVYVGNLMGSTGTLTIADGGTVAITGAFNVLRIADGAGSTGTVNIGNGAAPGVLSAGSVSFGNGTGLLNFNHTGLLVFGVPITGSAGTVNKLGAGDTLLTGVSNFGGSLVVRGGSVQLGGSGQINNLFGSIAPEVGDEAAVLVSNGSRWTTSTGSIFTGGLGDGLLQIESGGVVESGGEILVGRFASSRGELVVEGAGSSASAVGELRVADEGLGILRVENGGLLTSNKGFLARNAGTANATATITGANSRWNITNEINVGGFGDATLTISAGGVLTSGTGGAYNHIGGYDANGSGLVTVTGAGSQWALGSALGIANFGIASPGELRVLDGGAVSGTSLGIGSTGSLTVNGADSTLTMNSGIGINGSAVIEAGAVVSNLGPNAGLSLDGSAMNPASLRIDGAGSQWTTADYATIGFFGLADLTIRNGAIMNDARGFMSFDSTGRGNVIVEGAGSAWNHLGTALDGSNGFLYVGGNGHATLTIRSGGVVTTQNANTVSAAIALNPTSTSTVLVTGAGSAWTNAGSLIVGDLGSGTLTIADGATVSAGGGVGDVILAASAANTPNALGILNIGDGGAPGTLQAARVLLNGQPGVGQSVVNFDHTGEVVVGAAFSGRGFLQQVNSGKTILTGDSVLDPNFGFFSTFTGTFEISGGGSMSAPLNFVGYTAAAGPGSDGTTIVRGADSSWTATSPVVGVQVGGADIPGHLDVLEGALLSVIGLDVSRAIGFPTPAPGDVDVDGAGSRVMATGVIDVGVHGTGAFRVSNGGSVMSQLTGADSLILGDLAGSNGTVTVAGAGSIWTNAGNSVIGKSGRGTVNIEAGAVMSTANATLGLNAGATGAATITGAESQWNALQNIYVGAAGSGVMTIAAGGVVTSNQGVAGYLAGSTGAITITGAGSRWTISQGAFVGYGGPGTLTVADGGTLVSNGALLGFNNGVTGEVLVTGAGSHWNANGGSFGTIFVPNSTFPGGTATTSQLTIAAGGSVASKGAQIGIDTPSTGIAMITGAGSLWDIVEYPVIGGAGTGRLTIADGGVLRVGAGAGTVRVASVAGGNGIVSIGDGAAPGAIEAAAIALEQAGGALNFNHTGDLAFTIPINGPGVVAKLGAGTTTLSVDSSYSGGTTVSEGLLRVTNPNGLGLGSGAVTVEAQTFAEATLRFIDSASAGAIAITNGANAAGGFGATRFTQLASAGTATIRNVSSPVNAAGAITTFGGEATAGSATIINDGGFAPGIFTWGHTAFFENSTAGMATIVNSASMLAGQNGGSINFLGTSTAGAANITSYGGAVANGAAAGVVFQDSANAGTATFMNFGGTANGANGGVVNFINMTSAADATLTNLGGTVPGARGGSTLFFNSATASTADIEIRGATASGLHGGRTLFQNSSTAASSVITVRGGEVNGATGGRVEFRDDANGGTATITIENGGLTQFFNTSSAGSAAFTLLRGTNPIFLEFRDDSTAGSATITTAPGAYGGFFGTSDAGTATLNNLGETIAGLGVFGGSFNFNGFATAMNATIFNHGASVPGFGFGGTVFAEDSTAGSAAITNEGGMAADSPGAVTNFLGASDAGTAMIAALGCTFHGGTGGFILFSGNSSAEDAALSASGGSSGGTGGSIFFSDNSSGGNASAIVNGNGVLDISTLTSSGTTLGSIAGSGSFLLGAKSLTVGSNNTSTVVSGSITGTGGSLTKVGTGTLTLGGVQDYAALVTDGGTTNLNSPLGTGTSTITANAATNIGASQTLAALTINAGGIVTLVSAAPSAPAISEDYRALDFELAARAEWTRAVDIGGAGSATTSHAVPEPGAGVSLLGALVAWLGFSRTRRSRSHRQTTAAEVMRL